MTHKDSMSSKTYSILLLLIAAFSLWIRTGFPVYAIPSAKHDDALFIKLARTLEGGHWLGLYDNLTLAKGMVYPLFIAVSFWTSVPLKIAEQIVYLAACWLTVGVIQRRLGNRLPALILFALLAFNPVVWNLSFARVLRQELYMSLSLALVSLVVSVAFPIFTEENRGLRRLLWKGIALGLVGAAYWMTREEGAWLFPTVAVVMAMALIGIWRPNWCPGSEREAFPRRSTHLKTIAVPLVMALAVFTAADWLVAGINYRHYKVFETNEFRSRGFLRAYGAIQRIKSDHWRPFITFPKDARQRAYAVSPAARELESAFEGNIGKGWAHLSCTLMNKPDSCDEVEAGWAIWEFRDAVAAAGHYRSGAEAMRYYNTLADQINSACDRGVIQCLPARATLLPPFRWEYMGESLQASKVIAIMTFRMVEGSIGPIPSTPPDDGLAIFTDTVDGVIPARNETIGIWGWVAAARAVPTLRLVADTSEKCDSSINILPAPDVVAAYPTLKSTRFELKTDCPVAVCNLVLNVAGKDETRVPLSELLRSYGHGPAINNPALKLYVDIVSGLDSRKFTDSRRAAQVKIAGVMASTYANVFPLLALFSGVGLLMATFFRKRCPMPTSFLALGLGSASATVTLIALMAYLAASSDFSVANVLYTSPASPFVITFTFVGMYAWFRALRLGVSAITSSATLHRVLGRVDAKQAS
jgi:hypothetical protein